MTLAPTVKVLLLPTAAPSDTRSAAPFSPPFFR
jgi:hypothetical protein